MKTSKMIGLGLAFCLMTAIVLAEAKQGDPRKQPQRPGAEMKRPERPSRSARGGMDREEMYKQMMASRMKTHQMGIDELVAIKKIAEEEEATRTAEALQVLIDKKDKEFKDQLSKMEKSRRQRAEMIEKRAQDKAKTLKIDDDDDDKKEQPTVRQKRR